MKFTLVIVLIFFAKFDEIRNYRSREVWGNAFRKVDSYKTLLSNIVDIPFQRPDSKKNK